MTQSHTLSILQELLSICLPYNPTKHFQSRMLFKVYDRTVEQLSFILHDACSALASKQRVQISVSWPESKPNNIIFYLLSDTVIIFIACSNNFIVLYEPHSNLSSFPLNTVDGIPYC